MEAELIDKSTASKDKQPFALKLYNVVNTAPYITWSSDGDSFYINDVSKFEKEVMKDNFNNSCMLSFVRQLHIYGFRRLLDGRRTRYQTPTNYASFFHPCFKRDHPELLSLVQRQKRTKSTEEEVTQKEKEDNGARFSSKVKEIRPKPSTSTTQLNRSTNQPSSLSQVNLGMSALYDPSIVDPSKPQDILTSSHLNLTQPDGSLLDPTQATEILAQYPELFSESSLLGIGKDLSESNTNIKSEKKKALSNSDGADSSDSEFNPVFTIDASTNPPFLTYLHDPKQPEKKIKWKRVNF
ncbi:winged helix DNA-binding domain-containing protein [Conidiobolus coronatus NRRL 28638]|uniref:Winged helix DNA-binding domain-containing protein n=1 Tax=Conidiobolus coronatus (strain ATCC 28846 / CBS 209.66 / NRRL 28638) TaxID=796925 RepID=A0A137P320_CONC2|nr:winged helix DNA-binding domain-containing protein [Conidiobolus coronatus NRRL 28638]|eukprot:KXN69427.1 winged helix DNA-binding domain-containing protein [Conidiobolus coronatus NRRL 28638]